MDQKTTDRAKLHVVCVTGGRRYSDRGHVYGVLNRLHQEHPIDVLGHGGCDGADRLSDEWAYENCVQTVVFKVSGMQWFCSGRSAGPIRNRTMLIVCNPDLLVVFPGGNGTNGCHDLAVSMGITILDERRSHGNILQGR